jgi:AraC-like DNA-binding protein
MTSSPTEPTFDRLDSLLQRFSVSAQMFHSGALCGIHDFLEQEDLGQLHVIKGGEVEVQHLNRRETIKRPSVIFYPRPTRHRFVTDKNEGAEMACANVIFNAGAINPIALSLPPVVILPLDEIDGAENILDSLFKEAFGRSCGRQHVVNRLFEVVIVLILRSLLNRSRVDSGVLAGMAHPQLAKALIAIHSASQHAWSLEELSERAGMSRSQFAAVFRERVGLSPIDYLTRYRISIVQEMLRKGEPLKSIAMKAGYSGTAALSRTFTSVCGQSPRQWKQTQIDCAESGGTNLAGEACISKHPRSIAWPPPDPETPSVRLAARREKFATP